MCAIFLKKFPFGEFKKKYEKYDSNTTDNYGFFHVFYNNINKCEAIEIFKNVKIYLNFNQIFPDTKDNFLALTEATEY